MEVFPCRDGVLCGIEEVTALLQKVLPVSESSVWALEEGAPMSRKEVVLRISRPLPELWPVRDGHLRHAVAGQRLGHRRARVRPGGRRHSGRQLRGAPRPPVGGRRYGLRRCHRWLSRVFHRPGRQTRRHPALRHHAPRPHAGHGRYGDSQRAFDKYMPPDISARLPRRYLQGRGRGKPARGQALGKN